MVRELIKNQESVKFRWNESPLEKYEVHIYRYNWNKYDGYYHDEIMMRDCARRFWKKLIAMGFRLKPLPAPPSYES